MPDYEMNPTLRHDVLHAIDIEYGTEGSRKSRGNYISKVKCPTCGKAEAFTSSDSPWVVKCGRLNNCGEHHHVKELFPFLFESWTDRYQPKTEEERAKNPTAVADGYLRDGRGFDLTKIKGWYAQEYYQNHDLNAGSTTVRFQLPGKAFWERVLDKPERFGKLKARAVGSYKGQVWQAPIFTNAELMAAKRIILTEGIFDAISWIEAGHVAVSNISASNYPSEFLANLRKACADAGVDRPALCFAFDGDKAGRDAVRKFAKQAKNEGWNVGAAQPPGGRKKLDWNDLHQLGRMGEKDVEDYFYRGDLVLAKTPSDKALLMYNKRERREFWFTFETSLWWFKLDIEKYQKEVDAEGPDIGLLTPEQREAVLQRCGGIRKIASAVPSPLYFQENKTTNEQWYYFAIETDEGVGKLPFTPKQLTSASEFKNRMLAVKNAWWTGESRHLEQYLMDVTSRLKTVETIDYIGYSKEHGTYVWNDVAVRDGRMAKINSEDYYQFGRLQLKTLAQGPELEINPNKREYDATWPQYVYGAFQNTGTIALAWWLGSLFAEQIRDVHKSYPFFELVGEAGAGKSTLLEFMWKLYGRSGHEGFDPNKYTVAARSREFAQVSNLPIALIESDREGTEGAKAKQFTWDDIKDSYNGRPMRGRGVKNSGNDTYAPPFRAAFMISQNEPIDASDAILSRLCHIRVTREFQTQETYRNAQWLERCPTDSVSHFILLATSKEKELLNTFEIKTEKYKTDLLQNPNVRMVRIALVHAQMQALVDCLGPECLGLFSQSIVNDAKAQLITMAAERQQAINADHPLVQEFWEAVDYIDSTGNELKLNHLGYNDHGWAVNLKEFESRAGDYKLRIPDMRLLKTLLRTSKTRKFIEANKSVRSRIKNDHITKCWIFESQKGASAK